MTHIYIEDLGAQGDGIAHDNGRPLFIRGVLAGERVDIEISGDGSRPLLKTILEASPDRAQPSCPHYLVCGGCCLQHMKTEAMIAWQEKELFSLLRKHGLGHEMGDEVLGKAEILPCVVSPPQSRRRMRLAARHTKHGVVLGFNKPKSHEIVDLSACPVSLTVLQDFLAPLRGALAAWLPVNGTCDLQLTALSGGIDLVLIGGRALDLESRELLATLAERLDVAQLSWKKWDKSPAEAVSFRKPLSVCFGDWAVPFPAGSFLQATQAGEEALIAFAREAVGQAQSVLDLFCGLGGFGLSMPHAKTRHFADMDGPAVAALSRVAKTIPMAKVVSRNLVKDPYSSFECNAFDAIIFDPPRGGAKQQAERIAASTCPVVVAISCDPASFARDAGILIKGGYRLKKLQPVDQFLWSPHLEVAAVFVR